MSNKFQFLLLLMLFLGALFAINRYYENKISLLTSDGVQNESVKSTESQKATADNIGFSDLALFEGKIKALVSSVPGKMYFSSNVKSVSATEKMVEIRLEGYPDSIIYAADIEILYDQDGVEVLDIIKGDSFPLYPRTHISDDRILITGVSSVEKSNVVFGNPDLLFVTLNLRFKKGVSVSSLTINEEGTHIYFQTQNILDTDKNIKTIEI